MFRRQTRHAPSINIEDYSTNIGPKLIAAVAAAGHTPATTPGHALPISYLCEQYRGGFSIIGEPPTPAQKLSWFRRVFVSEPRFGPQIIATFWTDNWDRGATPEHWVVETHGRETLDTVTTLATQLSERFGADVTVRLLGEKPVYVFIPPAI